jgi:glycosyltransferase involved in cell wall biosynthesis
MNLISLNETLPMDMKKDFFFSVTIPAYKAKFLKECIDSILEQTYKNFELIIVNDASPQDLDRIVASYDDRRIRYYKNKKNCGAVHLVDNWNRCLNYASGDYILCMGDDDKLKPNCLEEYVKLINKYPGLNLYHALTEIIDENSQFYCMQEPRPKREGMFSMIYGRLHNCREQYIGDWLFKTKWLKNRGGYVDMPLAWSSDDLTAYLAAMDGGVANSQIPMFQYRVNTQTISNNGNTMIKFKAMMSAFEKIKGLLNMKNQRLNVLEEAYRYSCLQIIDETIRAARCESIMQDIQAKGKFFRTCWWLYNSRKLNVSQSEIIKVALKAINK